MCILRIIIINFNSQNKYLGGILYKVSYTGPQLKHKKSKKIASAIFT